MNRFEIVLNYGEKIYLYEYSEEKRKNYFKGLELNNHEVSKSVLVSFFDYFMINLKCIPELLLYENVKEAFKEIVINTIKYNHKDGYLRAAFMNAFLGEFEFGKSLSLEKDENKVFFKEIFKLYLEKAKKNETFVAYFMLKKIVFDNKDNLSEDFVNEIGAIYLSNNIFKFKKDDIKKTEILENYFLKQDLKKFTKDNKNLMNILNKEDVIEVKCYKFMIDYVKISNQTKTKSI